MMAKTELRYKQITRELQRVGLTSKVCKPLCVRRNWLCALHIISGKYKKNNKSNKLTISTSEIHGTYKSCATSLISPLLKEKKNQPTTKLFLQLYGKRY